ncbi:hypothetical protein M513_00015, partial [Trichuris suis]
MSAFTERSIYIYIYIPDTGPPIPRVPDNSFPPENGFSLSYQRKKMDGCSEEISIKNAISRFKFCGSLLQVCLLVFQAPTSSRFTVDHRQAATVLQVIDFSESLINDTSIEAEASILENEEDSQLSDGEQKITANLPPSEKWDVPCTQSKRMKCVSVSD